MDPATSSSSGTPTATTSPRSSSAHSPKRRHQQQQNHHHAKWDDKARQIRAVLNQQPVIDLWQLRALALSDGGLVNGTL